jgi:SAM-dependent methyltransferase
MSFNVSADAYNAFMGGFSEPLSDEFLAFAGVSEGGRALDVGCGPGALTQRLVDLLGSQAVSAVDPSPSFVEAARARFPGVDVQEARAEALPYADDSFDAALAQLVVHFMSDPVGGLREMGRVVRPGGVVAACVWDHADQGGPLSGYWAAVRELDPTAPDEADLAGAREGDLVRIAHEAGLDDVEGGVVRVTRTYATFEQWWEPYTFGIGPAGQYVRSLDETALRRLKDHCATKFPHEPFGIVASAWAVRGRAPIVLDR